jgi:dienelactone hydrolase
MRRSFRHWAGALAVAAVAVAPGLVGCSSTPAEHVGIDVDNATSMADQPVHLTLTGLRPDQEVTVSAEASDWQSELWHSHAVFHADTQGRVVLDTASPVSGTYRGADGMGLFWSMNPDQGDPDQSSLFYGSGSSFHLTLSAVVDGRQVASRRLTREWTVPGVTRRKLTVAADHVAGELFLPPAGASHHTAVLAFGGSEGGDSAVTEAALLASHGYPCLALGYFDMPGLPQTLGNVPLEYFASAARLLAAQPGVDPAHVLALGYSRGSEAALLLADSYPDLFHGAVVYSPSAQANPGYPDPRFAAWTRNGQAVPFGPIALDHIDGPVLAIGGADDQIWTGALWARQIDQELTADDDRYPHQALVYPNAGHLVGTFPYMSAGTNPMHRLRGAGGTRAGDEAAQVAGWQQLLAFLAAVRS